MDSNSQHALPMDYSDSAEHPSPFTLFLLSCVPTYLQSDHPLDLVYWNELHPEVWNEGGGLSVVGSDRQACYRISSPAGGYECSVTGLRWVSDGDVSLMYHFTDWEPYIEALKRMQYEPCGPLIDITIISGVLNEVHLPHFACLGSSPSLNDQVRVLDVQDSGMFLETCELTRFHAKLLHPTFSPKGFLVRTGFPVKVHCEVLIYRTLIAHLTLHIYLVPCDAKIIQNVDKKEQEDTVKIPKPGPERSLTMRSWYKIETKRENEYFSSKIKPERLKLRYSPIKYSEVYIKNAKDDFELHLINEEKKSIWDVEIRAEEYGKTSSFPDSQRDLSKEYAVWFVNKHRNALIQRVSLVAPIADDLKSLLDDEKYSTIRKRKTSQEQMRKLYSFLSGGQKIEESAAGKELRLPSAGIERFGVHAAAGGIEVANSKPCGETGTALFELGKQKQAVSTFLQLRYKAEWILLRGPRPGELQATVFPTVLF
ncbi:hypothetical protein SRHO_G00252350 [Serrasalmus rhombeus]